MKKNILEEKIKNECSKKKHKIYFALPMKFEKLTLENYEETKNLSEKYGLKVLEKTHWENIWKKNPFIIDLGKEWTIGWKLINEKNNIVGIIHNIPFIFYYKKKKFIAAVTGNWVVDNKYKSFSLKLRSKFLNQENIDFYITNTANKISEKAMEAFKAKKILQYNYDKRMIYMLNKKKIILSYIKKLSFNKNLIEDLKKLKNIFNKKNNIIINNSFEVANNFSNDFNNFNERLSNSETLYSSKELRWLNWKYSRLINTDRLWVIKNYEKEKLKSFLVFVVNYEKKYNLKKSTIVEMSFVESKDSGIDEMIKKCILISNKLNCDLVDVIGFNKHKKDLLSKMGFLDKKTGNFGFLVKNSNSEIENILFNDENTLDMSLTDGDAVFSL